MVGGAATLRQAVVPRMDDARPSSALSLLVGGCSGRLFSRLWLRSRRSNGIPVASLLRRTAGVRARTFCCS